MSEQKVKLSDSFKQVLASCKDLDFQGLCAALEEFELNATKTAVRPMKFAVKSGKKKLSAVARRSTTEVEQIDIEPNTVIWPERFCLICWRQLWQQTEEIHAGPAYPNDTLIAQSARYWPRRPANNGQGQSQG